MLDALIEEVIGQRHGRFPQRRLVVLLRVPKDKRLFGNQNIFHRVLVKVAPGLVNLHGEHGGEETFALFLHTSLDRATRRVHAEHRHEFVLAVAKRNLRRALDNRFAGKVRNKETRD